MYLIIAVIVVALSFTSIMIDRQLSQRGHSIDIIDIYAGGENALITVVGPTQTVSPGETFDVSITIEPNNAIAGVQFSLAFDASLITVDSVQEGGLLSQDGASTYFYSGQTDNQTGNITGVAGAIISPGQTVSTAGTLTTITMTAGSTEGTGNFTLSNVIIGDAQGQSVSVSIDNGQAIISSNQAPVLSSIGNKSLNEGESLQVVISANDPNEDELTYSASNLPSPWASFDTQTQTLTLTPLWWASGTYTSVHFEVTDGELTDSEDITITIIEVNPPPVLDPIGNKSVNEGELIQFTISATDPQETELSYSASNLPSGASFDTETLTFTWTPTYAQSGTYTSVHFEVTDNDLTDSENIAITVNQPYDNWDINQDGSVNVLDMVRIGQHWDETGSAGWIVEDANEDGTIDVLDMILIGQNWTA